MLRSRNGCLKVVCSSCAAFEAGEFCGRAEFAGGDDGGRKFGGDDVDRIRLRAG